MSPCHPIFDAKSRLAKLKDLKDILAPVSAADFFSQSQQSLFLVNVAAQTQSATLGLLYVSQYISSAA